MNVTRTWRLVAAFALTVPFHGLAQEDAAGKPAPSNVRGKEFPLIHPDRRVTFRVTERRRSLSRAARLRVRWYRSKTTGQHRQVHVYTPPGHNSHPTLRYPVLYLQHGSGEDQTSWTRQGKANLIMDNLIAEGKARPMLVVMEQGYAVKAGQAAGGTQGSEAFGELVIRDLVPMIDSTYRTLDDRHHRAIAGLSMGAGQAMRIGLANLDRFASIGSFSGGSRAFDAKTSYDGVFADSETVNGKLDLLWIGCGTGDRLHPGATSLHQALNAAGVRHVWFEGPGSHEWQVWRKHLHDFAPRLFRGSAGKQTQ